MLSRVARAVVFNYGESQRVERNKEGNENSMLFCQLLKDYMFIHLVSYQNTELFQEKSRLCICLCAIQVHKLICIQDGSYLQRMAMILMFIIYNTLLVQIQESDICAEAFWISQKLSSWVTQRLLSAEHPSMCFVAHTVLVLNANISVLNVAHQGRGHLGREGLGSEMTWFMEERS